MSDLVGKSFESKTSGKYTVKEYINASEVLVEFEDGFQKWAAAKEVRNGYIKNPFNKTLYGRGFYGTASDVLEQEYNAWQSMFFRCYSNKYPAYEGCEVDPVWYDLGEFLKFYREHYVKGFALDKDLTVRGNKLYSPDLCCFVPAEINSLLVNCKRKRGKYPVGVSAHKVKGRVTYRARCHSIDPSMRAHLGCYSTPEMAFEVYKKYKESVIKSKADKWKDKIDSRVYEYLMNYTVEITD